MRVKKRKVRGQWSEAYYARIPDGKGGTKLVSTRCSDRKAAEDRARELERSAVAPRQVPQLTTKEACERFLASRVMLGRSTETQRFYEPKLGNLIENLPEMLADCTHGELEDYIAIRLEDVSRPTVKKELRTFKSVLRHARRNGYFEGEPDQVIPEFDGEEVSRKRVLSAAELPRLLDALEGSHKGMFCGLLAFGLRLSEGWKRLGPSKVRVYGTKTVGADREVPIEMAWQKKLAKKAEQSSGWTNAVRDLARACERAGIPRVTPNDLRRTFGTWLLRDGVEKWVIAKLMGHTTTRMLDVHYGKPTTDDLAKAMRRKK